MTRTKKTKPANAGFSLLEILITMLLVAGIGYVALKASGFNQNRMDEAVAQVERAMRFSMNESLLRGNVVRLRFDIAAERPSFRVESVQKANFVVPDFSRFDKEADSLSLEELEQRQDLEKGLDQQFQPLPAFSEEDRPIADGVKIIGVASSTRYRVLVTDRPHSIYFYPSGEKDSALVILGNDQEIAWISVAPFLSELTTEYETLAADGAASTEQLFTKGREIYEEWMNNES